MDKPSFGRRVLAVLMRDYPGARPPVQHRKNPSVSLWRRVLAAVMRVNP